MADVPPSELRIGDTERETALTALGEHMSAGRLDIDEYGDRTAKVSAAKTRGELLALFTDLPQPHPVFGQPKPAAATAAMSQSAGDSLPLPVAPRMPVGQRIMAATMPLAAIIALALFFALGHWQFFLIIPAVGILGGIVWGDDWKHKQRMVRDAQREERRAIRRQYRRY